MDKDRTDCLSPIGLVRRARAGAMRLTAPAGLDHGQLVDERGLAVVDVVGGADQHGGSSRCACWR